MYLTVHGAAALAVAQAVPNPFLAFVLALATHFILDFIPHGDEHLIQKHFSRGQTLRRLMGTAMVDGILLVGFVAIYVWTTPLLNLPVVFFSLAGAMLPDLLQGLYFVSLAPWLKPINTWHNQLHNATRHPLNWQQGMLVQCLVLTALWLLVI